MLPIPPFRGTISTTINIDPASVSICFSLFASSPIESAAVSSTLSSLLLPTLSLTSEKKTTEQKQVTCGVNSSFLRQVKQVVMYPPVN